MKKIGYLCLFVLMIGILSYIGINFIWKGWYETGAGKTLNIQIRENKIHITSNFGMINSALRVSYVDYDINESKKEIYIWLYSKYYNWELPFIKWRDVIETQTSGTYKVYYKNKDGSLTLIKEVEFQ